MISPVARTNVLKFPAPFDTPASKPMALDDDVEMIDLNSHLTKGNSKPLFLRVFGESVVNEIDNGDWIIIDQEAQPKPGNIVVAKLNGGYTLKRFKWNDGRGKKGLFLVPATGQAENREVTGADDIQIAGVVTQIIKSTTPRV